MDIELDYQRCIDAADRWIADRPGTVILLFLVLSGGFTLELGASGTESGTSQFTEDIPAQTALENINDNFERVTFGADSGSTQLIQSHPNVLSRPALLRMLRAQHRLSDHPDLNVRSSNSAARIVARTLNPTADGIQAEIDAVEGATPGEIDQAVQRASREQPQIRSLLSNDFNSRSASASATVGTVTHRVPSGLSSSVGAGGGSPLTSLQQRSAKVVSSVGGDITVFGSGIVSGEFSSIIGDSLRLVIPAAVVLILFFLIVAYRDPVDLGLGIVSLAMAILWTFGFMGLVGIEFSQMLIAVPPLLLAVGIDFGIHAINRYREERVQGADIRDSMRITTDQLLVAFAIVTGTTVIGFGANLSSELAPIRDFGVVAAVGIVFTFCIFGVFLPAAKVYADLARKRVGFPAFGSSPLGSEDSVLGRVLPVGVSIAKVAPVAFLVVVLLSTAMLGVYGSGVDSRFTQDQFLPPEENPGYLEYFPQQLQPSEYTVTRTTNFLEERFQSGEDDRTTVYVEGSLTKDAALETMWRAGDDPPAHFVTENGHARETSIVTVIQSYADRDPGFAKLVARNDLNDNGVPDQNLKTIYGALLDSPARGQALNYITESYTAARVVYAVEADASQETVTEETRAVADRYRMTATATGSTIVLKAVSDVIGESAFASLVIALVASGAFLVAIYTLVEGRPLLGVVNLVPIIVAVTGIAATMRFLDIPFNALTGTILSIGIGIGIDYSAHLVHRFSEEYEGRVDVEAALLEAVRGTGGALTGSMLTTVSEIGVLVLAITPLLGQFGILIGISVLYSYLASLIILPSAILIWDRFRSFRTDGHHTSKAPGELVPMEQFPTIPPNPRRMDMPETHEEIMLATHDALAEVGYADLSISTIANHFEGSQSLIYYHYDDKAELLVAFLDHLIDELDTELDAIERLDPSDRIQATIDLLLPVTPQAEPFRFHHALIEIRVQAPYHEPFRDRFEQLDERLATMFEQAITESQNAGTFSAVDPETAADRLLTEVYGVHYRNVPMEDMDRIRNSRERIAEQIQTWEARV